MQPAPIPSSIWRAGLLVGLLAVLAALSAPRAGHAAAGEPCTTQNFAGSSFVVCAFDPRHDDIRLFWKGRDGKPYSKFQPVVDALKAQGRSLNFAMNGGIYEANFAPLGLYVEDGKQLRRANQRDGSGNFHLKPNGVFFIGKETAGVMETSLFLSTGQQPRYATQSGPMLVLDNAINSKIHGTGTSKKIRNGVGVRNDGLAVFAISADPVTFHDFAQFFRDRLGCPNALYLDGSISQLYAPGLGRDDELWPLGPIIGVVGAAPQN